MTASSHDVFSSRFQAVPRRRNTHHAPFQRGRKCQGKLKNLFPQVSSGVDGGTRAKRGRKGRDENLEDEDEDSNLSDGNIGNGNVGNGNVGNGNIGNDNIGNGNVGNGNIGDGNAGDGNIGDGNGSVDSSTEVTSSRTHAKPSSQTSDPPVTFPRAVPHAPPTTQASNDSATSTAYISPGSATGIESVMTSSAFTRTSSPSSNPSSSGPSSSPTSSVSTRTSSSLVNPSSSRSETPSQQTATVSTTVNESTFVTQTNVIAGIRRGSKDSIPIIAGSIVGVVLLCFLVGAFIYFCRRRSPDCCCGASRGISPFTVPPGYGPESCLGQELRSNSRERILPYPSASHFDHQDIAHENSDRLEERGQRSRNSRGQSTIPSDNPPPYRS